MLSAIIGSSAYAQITLNSQQESLYQRANLIEIWSLLQSDRSAALEQLDARTKSPFLKILDGSPTDMLVTHVHKGEPETNHIIYSGGPDFNGMRMNRFADTRYFFVTQQVSRKAQFSFAFNHYNNAENTPKGFESFDVVYGDRQTLSMPDAALSKHIEARENVPTGEVIKRDIKSKILQQDRTISIYTPPGYSAENDYPLLLVMDGRLLSSEANAAAPSRAWIPTPTILDNLINEQAIKPTIAVFIWNMRDRRVMLPSDNFRDFVTDELLPMVKDEFSIAVGPENITAAGVSRGGFAAAKMALARPDLIGQVVSLSGAFWITDKVIQDETSRAPFRPNQYVYPRETGLLIEQVKKAQLTDVRFIMTSGIYEDGVAQVASNRQMRDALELKGYDIDFGEFHTDHGYYAWRHILADALIKALN
jgi:enterochelin esterase family protein